ncbi:unnamed protein product [Tilletia laevis]|nr:unnamed protein product [Tilletia laevis]
MDAACLDLPRRRRQRQRTACDVAAVQEVTRRDHCNQPFRGAASHIPTTSSNHHRWSLLIYSKSNVLDLRAAQRTFDGAYARTILGRTQVTYFTHPRPRLPDKLLFSLAASLTPAPSILTATRHRLGSLCWTRHHHSSLDPAARRPQLGPLHSSQGSPRGRVRLAMRVLRPWSDEAFMSSVPTSVEVLHDLHESRLITAPVGPPDCFMKKSLPPTSTGPSLPRRLSRPASSRSRVAPPPSSAVGPGSTTSCLLRRAVNNLSTRGASYGLPDRSPFAFGLHSTTFYSSSPSPAATLRSAARVEPLVGLHGMRSRKGCPELSVSNPSWDYTGCVRARDAQSCWPGDKRCPEAPLVVKLNLCRLSPSSFRRLR